MRNSSLQTLLLIGLIMFSCESGKNYKEISADAVQKHQAKQSSTERQTDKDIENPVTNRKIIKKGSIRFETGSIEQTKEHIDQVVNDLGGYVSHDNLQHYPGKIEESMTVRIPAENFDILLTRISGEAKKIDSKTINAQDVTEEYMDVRARVKTKKAVANRYKQLLQKANTIKDILAIEEELGNIQEEIESAEGRLQYLKNRIVFSTLHITFYKQTSTKVGFFSKLGRALVKGWKGLLYFFIGLAYIWPFILIIGVGIFFGLRIRKRRKHR